MNSSPLVCTGSGFVALDVVYLGSSETPIGSWAGGSCCNVLTVLSFLGWEAHPIARLGDDEAAERLLKDLGRFGVCQELIRRDRSVSTPIVIETLRQDPGRRGVHSFSATCPHCGRQLPRYDVPRRQDVMAALPIVERSHAFYFDRVSDETFELATAAKAAGALVVFEPPEPGDGTGFLRGAEVAHIVKFSHERFERSGELKDAAAAPLIIETRGKDGVRYRITKAGAGGWRHVPAYEASTVRDTAGAGDWCTAGIIYELFAASEPWQGDFRQSRVEAALSFGQALALVACRFEGARGAMYRLNSEHAIRLAEQVRQGDDQVTEGEAGERFEPRSAQRCPHCTEVKRPS